MTDLERVRKGLVEDGVHSPTTDGRGSRLVSYCRYDGEKWPCSTVAELDAHLLLFARLHGTLKDIASGRFAHEYCSCYIQARNALIEEN